MNLEAAPPAELASRKTWVDWLHRLGPLLALVVVFGIFAALVPLGWMPENFLSLRNFETIARQTTIVGIASLGMTLIIISGGIDLSVGSTIALSTVVIALSLQNQAVGWIGALLPGTLIGGLSAISVASSLRGRGGWRVLGIVLGVALGLPVGIVVWRTMIGMGSNAVLAGMGCGGLVVVALGAGLPRVGWSPIVASLAGVVAGVPTTVGGAWALHAFGFGPSPVVAALAGVAAGAAAGLANGFLITRLKVVPFIVTLGTMLVLRGAAKGLGHEQRVEAPMTWINELLAALPPDRRWMIVPPGVWLLIVLALVMAGVLRYTKLGRHTFAIGSNELTARLCGVAVSRVKLVIYTLSAALAGLSGLMQFSRLTVGDPSVATGLELDVIAAVVIGGGSLSGGEGSILGSLVGALIMTVISSGCSQMGLPSWVQQIVTGGIIIAAVALDRLRHRRAA